MREMGRNRLDSWENKLFDKYHVSGMLYLFKVTLRD